MALSAGARLGPYKIVTLIGAGGMGEVYKARDTRLNRIVAIKILPSHDRADPDHRRRLEREAQAIAALAHPHICVLHDIGRHEDCDFLVMEFWRERRLRAGCAGTAPARSGAPLRRPRSATRSTRRTAKASSTAI